MSAAAFLRLGKLKGGGIIATAARHNRRVIQAELGASGSIDPTRTRLNETLRGPPTADDVALHAKDLMRAAGVGKLRRDAVMGLEVVFSLPPNHQINDRAYFNDCATWAAGQFGGDQNILSVDVHRDEAAPHCHVILLPMLAGKMAGSDMVGNRHKLTELQQDFHRAVASRYGFSKAPARLSGAPKRDAAATVVGTLRKASDAALRSKVWPILRAAIESDPAPFVLALGIELERPKKRLRSMTAIFTSPGKGPKQEPNPIGFAAPARDRTLSCVGLAASSASRSPPPPPPPPPRQALEQALEQAMPQPTSQATATATATARCETTRVRESDLDASMFDSETGEFRRKPAPPTRLVKAEAAAWVAARLKLPPKMDG